MSSSSSEEVKEDDEISTPEERLNWLRERGVLIETSEDRKPKEAAVDAEDTIYKLISFVCIPHDSSKPLRELSLPIAVVDETSLGSKTSGDRLPFHLKPMFAAHHDNNGGGVDLELLRQQATHHLATSSSSDNHDATVSDATMRRLAEEGQVETFSLVRPTPSNKHTAVNLYLDEVGMLKRLPLNPRAADLALRAGFRPPPTFYGDVYVGRSSNIPTIENRDFKLGVDTAPDADWLNNATMANLEYQTEMNRITGKTPEEVVQPPKAGEDGIAKEEKGYTWTQTDEEVEILWKNNNSHDNEIASTKDVKVVFRPTYVQLLVRGNAVLKVVLFATVDPDGCTWTLDREKGELSITCEKSEAVSWPRVTF